MMMRAIIMIIIKKITIVTIIRTIIIIVMIMVRTIMTKRTRNKITGKNDKEIIFESLTLTKGVSLSKTYLYHALIYYKLLLSSSS